MDQLDLDITRGPDRPQQGAVPPDRHGAEADRSLWAEFAEAATAESFCRSWLAIQCRKIGGVRGGLVLIGPPGSGPFSPAAVWPSPQRNVKYLAAAAEQALKEARGVLLKRDPTAEPESPSYERYDIAYPFQLDGKLLPARRWPPVSARRTRSFWSTSATGPPARMTSMPA